MNQRCNAMNTTNTGSIAITAAAKPTDGEMFEYCAVASGASATVKTRVASPGPASCGHTYKFQADMKVRTT